MGVAFDITGNNTGFLRALEQSVAAAKAASEGVSSAFGKVTDTFEKITKAATLFTAVIAGGAAFKESIEATKRLDETAISLGKSLGISASQAGVYAAAISEVGGSSDDFQTAIQGLTRQVKKQEGALNDMGIATRDSSGHLRDMSDILFDAVKVVNSYAEGTDRNLAAQMAFGRGMQANSPIFRLTKEDMDRARQSALDLGLVVGEQNVKDFEANRVATAEAGLVMQGLKKAVGDELLPVLTQFAQWFRQIGPAAIQVLRTALADIVSVFWILNATVNAVWQTIRAMIISVIGPLSALGMAIYYATTGQWDKAKQTVAEIGPTLKAAWSSTFEDIVATAQKAQARIAAAFTDPVADAQAPAAGKQFAGGLSGNEKKTPEKSHQFAEDEIRQANEILDEMKRVYAAEAEDYLQAQLGEVATKEEALKEQLRLGEVSSKEFLTQENALIAQRLEAEKEYYAKKKQLVVADSAEAAKIQTDITKAEATAQKQRQLALNLASNAQMAEWKKLGNSIASNMVSSIKGILEGTQTFAGAIKSLFATLIDGIIGIFAQMAVKWAENMIMQKILGKTTALSQITANAGIAATAAMASVAAIPFYGWAMAPEVGAATFAEAEGYAASVSAMGGYDIPAGVNPVGQLHAEEMVLPPPIANAVRSMATSGEGTGGGPRGSQSELHLHIHAWDGKSVDSWMRNGGAAKISDALQTYHRI